MRTKERNNQIIAGFNNDGKREHLTIFRTCRNYGVFGCILCGLFFTPYPARASEEDAQAAYNLAEDYRNGSNGQEVNAEEAIRYYKLAVENSAASEDIVVRASFYIGKLMAANDTEADDAEAASWYEKAIDLGSVSAMNNLAFMYEKGQGVPQDYEKAMELYEEAAEGGNFVSMNNLGINYEKGECGQEINLEESLKWYHMAADNDYEDAQESVERVLETAFTLAQQYYLGIGGYEKDWEEASRYYRLVAEDDSAKQEQMRDACQTLGSIIQFNEDEDDDSEAVPWHEKAIEAGSVLAVTNLALMYQSGKGVPVDYEKSMELFHQAADGGDSTAMYNLAMSYEFGLYGQEKNLEEALKWYKAADEKGFYGAQDNVDRVQEALGIEPSDSSQESESEDIGASYYALGDIYENGKYGEEVDLEAALQWYKLAEAEGYDHASETIAYVLQEIYDLAEEYRKGTNGKEKDAEKAFGYYKLVAEEESADSELAGRACLWLGNIMEEKATSESYAEAASWFQKALEKGNLGGANNLAFLYQDGKGVPQDYEKAIELLRWAATAGEASAMNNLAFKYEYGECGLEKDLKEALKWFQKAADNNFDGAQESVERVQSKLSGQ